MKGMFLAIGLLFGLASQAYNCCSVAKDGVVRFTSQTNIVIWDPTTGTEHFVRTARFSTGAKDFGFIAPTPTQPHLDTADSKCFSTLRALDPRQKSSYTISGGFGGRSSVFGPPVKVFEVKDVAGYRASVVKATDARALEAWMKENGYVTSPTIVAWLKHYISRDWFLTLFKVISQGEQTATGAVRMSFQTQAPFNPYLVPKDNFANAGGGLELFFVGPGEYVPSNPPLKTTIAPDWRADVPEATRALLNEQLKVNYLPDKLRVAHYWDRTFPNPSAVEDLYFRYAGAGPSHSIGGGESSRWR